MTCFSHPLRGLGALPAALPAFVLAGIFLGSPPAAAQTDPAPLSLRLVPKEIRLWGTGATQRIVLLGRYADGLERDLTAKADFSVSGHRGGPPRPGGESGGSGPGSGDPDGYGQGAAGRRRDSGDGHR